MTTLNTDRLILRLFQESDLDAYAEMCADPQVMQYLSGGKLMTRAEAWRNMALVLGHWHLRGFGLWAVEERSSGVMIGRIGCWQPEGWPALEIGWTLRSAYWGQGFATEGGRAALNYALTTLGQTRVISLIAPENQPSMRVAERLGGRFEQEIELMGDRALLYRYPTELA
jgi:RimJ/RimL family protein N-acetyltransferase